MMEKKLTAETPAEFDISTLKKNSQLRSVWARLKRNKMAMGAAVLVLILVLCAVFAEYIAPYPYDKTDIAHSFEMPSLQHPLGTDDFGRDLLSRLIYGARVSLFVSVMSILIGMVFGIFLGLTSGYFGGIYESIVMRCIDILMALPGFLLSVTVSAALGTGLLNTAIAISISTIPSYCRLVRATVLSLKSQEYVESATAFGASSAWILLKHVLPNTFSPIIV